MKKGQIFISVLVIFSILVFVCQSCAPSKWYMIDHDLLWQYNRHTGEVELISTLHAKSVATDSVKTEY